VEKIIEEDNPLTTPFSNKRANLILAYLSFHSGKIWEIIDGFCKQYNFSRELVKEDVWQMIYDERLTLTINRNLEKAK
jgi:hypothetical protein